MPFFSLPFFSKRNHPTNLMWKSKKLFQITRKFWPRQNENQHRKRLLVIFRHFQGNLAEAAFSEITQYNV